MANVLADNVWILDTTGTIALAEDYPQIRVKAIRWVGASSGNQAKILDDASGNILWEAIAATNNYTDFTHFDGCFELRAVSGGAGLQLGTLDAGVVYLYLA